ncbi:recombinase family protein [Sinorhizobium meliloti]|uniref:recombinase family protein n=1 Tax=Rhizobium meliloti TaxID=382 RepID=UPI003D65A9C6
MRVSSADERQSVDLQRDALIAAGVDERHLHQDKASGARDDRPGLKACMKELRSGDVLVGGSSIASDVPCRTLYGSSTS